MREPAIRWVEVNGQRYYATRALRLGLAALAAGPAALLAIYPTVQPATATHYIAQVHQQGLVQRVSPRRTTAVYALTAQGRAVRAALEELRAEE
jgi:hypothetical protein